MTVIPVDFTTTSPSGGPPSVVVVIKHRSDTNSVKASPKFPGINFKPASSGSTLAMVSPLTPTSNMVMVVTTSVTSMLASVSPILEDKGCVVPVSVTFTVVNSGGTGMFTGMFFNVTVSKVP